LSQDSRSIPDGGLFVAVQGAHHDAHLLLADAARAGARALLLQRDVEVPPGCAAAVVGDTRLGLALAAAALAGHPTDAMTLIGVTGTDGKTTSCILTTEALLACGVKAGAMTSLDFRCLDQVETNPTYRTTLEAPEVQQRMRVLRDAGVSTAVLETTSHGIDQHRVAGVEFDVAAFTNLSHEHLDYHGTLEEYRRVKLRLATMTWSARRKPGVPKALVYNADDPAWQELVTAPADRRVSFGMGVAADLRATQVQPEIGRVRFEVVRERGGVMQAEVPLTGRFNVANALCALAVCEALELPLEQAVEGLATARGLRGRMQVLDAGQPFAVVVDYAHTPDGLEQVLSELRPLTRGRLLTVFGAPGDRDAAKRPLMGRAVARIADRFVITTDDPRHESAAEICAAIAAGALAEGRASGRDFVIILDRREAIREILRQARPGDTVLLAGKGHEDRMLIGEEELPWDEAREAHTALAELGAGR
jgi:UDP-N-acetylmuramoyl-L-alanyl-D-glutamate--2,6-diaminopimelate ligase